MKFTFVILREVISMKMPEFTFMKKWSSKLIGQSKTDQQSKSDGNMSIFFSIVQKEFTDYIKSWRIIILLIIIGLTCLGSLYTAVTTLEDVLLSSDDLAREIAKESHLFLKLFTVSDGTLPSFITFVTFLGPLLGIALGFDAINSERNRGRSEE